MYNSLLDTFLCVADCGSFTKASERLYISSTSVMNQINALENHLEIKLFKRTPRGIILTEAGQVSLRRCKADDSVFPRGCKAGASTCRGRPIYHKGRNLPVVPMQGPYKSLVPRQR